MPDYRTVTDPTTGLTVYAELANQIREPLVGPDGPAFKAPDSPLLAAITQPYLSWRERQANQSGLAGAILPSALPNYGAGLSYGTLPKEAPFTSVRSTETYLPAALDVMGAATAVRGLGRGLADIAGKAGTESWNAAKQAVEQGRAWPQGQVSIFAGTSARTADMQAYRQARALEAGGADPKTIWSETGWFKGADGQWRFEIPDQAAALNPYLSSGQVTSWGPGDKITAQQTLEHPDLYAAYPELGSVRTQGRITTELDKLRGGAESYLGGYGDNTIYLNSPLESTKSTMLHELQHAIQDREGFSPGTNPDAMRAHVYNPDEAQALGQALDYADALKQAGGDKVKARQLFTEQFNGPPSDVAVQWAEIYTPQQLESLFSGVFKRPRITPMEAYERAAGEAEARAVQARQAMTPAQRRATFPYESYDVLPEQLLRVKPNEGLGTAGPLADYFRMQARSGR